VRGALILKSLELAEVEYVEFIGLRQEAEDWVGRVSEERIEERAAEGRMERNIMQEDSTRMTCRQWLL